MCHRSTLCISSRKVCPAARLLATEVGARRRLKCHWQRIRRCRCSLFSYACEGIPKRYTPHWSQMPANTPELTADQRSKSGSYQRRAAQLFMYSYYSGRTENVTEGCCTHFLALTSLPFLEICKIQWTCNLCTSQCAQIHYVVRAVIGWDIKYTRQL